MKQDAAQSAATADPRKGSPVDSVQVAALFIDPSGPYPDLVGIEHCWSAERDARTYAGPWPVVAHPPCQLWGPFALVNFVRWGGEHNRPGNDGGCFAMALHAVRRFGGVLEHPAFSKAWSAHFLRRPPVAGGWGRLGAHPEGGAEEWACEVWQSAYGHMARKRTWLFYVGQTPPDLRWDRLPGTHQCGFHDQRGKARNKPTLPKREAARTPDAFARELVRLAQVSGIRNGANSSC